MSDDGKLVTKKDLYEKPYSQWNDKEQLDNLEKDMTILEEMRFSEEFPPDSLVLECITEVLHEVGWYDYQSFSESVNKIIMYGPQSVPLSTRARDIFTMKKDFWIQKVMIDLSKNDTLFYKGAEYKKLDVIMSKKFSNTLRNYCRNKLNDKLQFWCFSGNYSGKQSLNMTKFSESDINYIQNKYGHTEPTKFIMIQFKKKNKDVFLHDKNNINAIPVPTVFNQPVFNH